MSKRIREEDVRLAAVSIRHRVVVIGRSAIMTDIAFDAGRSDLASIDGCGWKTGYVLVLLARYEIPEASLSHGPETKRDTSACIA